MALDPVERDTADHYRAVDECEQREEALQELTAQLELLTASGIRSAFAKLGHGLDEQCPVSCPGTGDQALTSYVAAETLDDDRVWAEVLRLLQKPEGTALRNAMAQAHVERNAHAVAARQARRALGVRA